MEIESFLSTLLSYLQQTYNNGKHKNCEIQVGFCRTGGDLTIYISDNKGFASGFYPLSFDSKSIKNYIKDHCTDANSEKYQLVIVGTPHQFSGCLHAEMNIIRQLLIDISKKNNITQSTTLYLKGGKWPCKKCQEFIDLLNSVASQFITVNVLSPTDTKNPRQSPSEWSNPMDYLSIEEKQYISALPESVYNTLLAVKSIKKQQ